MLYLVSHQTLSEVLKYLHGVLCLLRRLYVTILCAHHMRQQACSQLFCILESNVSTHFTK